MSRIAAAVSRRWPAALGALFVLAFYGPLALPGRVLAARDMAFLHLPLRTDFRRLLADGLPRWDGWLHGGQPLLSNPHYAAWYPTTWLLVILPPHVALQGSILLHAALAFAGAWRLARQWGTGRVAASFAAIAYAGGGFFAGLPDLPLIFFGMAWWPWVMAAGDRALRAAPGSSARQRTHAGLALAALLALQVLNGDPAAVLASGLGLLALALDAGRGGHRPWRRLGVAVFLAVALAGVQFVPTVWRLRDSSRAAGLGTAEAAVWSTRPLRLVETVFPRLYGDPTRDEEDLYFGWQLHDHDYPFLLSIYPGLLVTLLEVSGLARRGIPRRAALAAGVAAEVLLGVGRHEPLWPLLHRGVPFLAQLRYPEKFLLLAAACLVFAAALELERLLAAQRDSAEGRRAFFPPLALAAVAATAAGILCALFLATPTAAANFVRSHSGLAPSASALTKGVAYLRSEALLALALSSLALAGLLLLRSRMARRSAATAFVVGLLLADLWWHDRALNPTMSLDDFEALAPAGAALAPGARIFSEGDVAPTAAVGLRVGPPGEQQLRARLGRLEPLSATLWGHSEVLERDYDLMLTGWGRWARRLLEAEWANPSHAARLLDAWSVEARVRPRRPEELLAALRAGESSPEPAEIALNPTALPRARAVEQATFHRDAPGALSGARADSFDVGRHEHLVGEPSGERDFAPAEIALAERAGDRMTLRVQPRAASNQPVLVTLAMTFDDGWRASATTGELPTWPTALGQLALQVPPGVAVVELRYRDPWVRVGGLVSLLAVLGCLFASLRSRAE